jgi:hypothetical protein
VVHWRRLAFPIERLVRVRTSVAMWEFSDFISEEGLIDIRLKEVVPLDQIIKSFLPCPGLSFLPHEFKDCSA